MLSSGSRGRVESPLKPSGQTPEASRASLRGADISADISSDTEQPCCTTGDEIREKKEYKLLRGEKLHFLQRARVAADGWKLNPLKVPAEVQKCDIQRQKDVRHLEGSESAELQ